MPRAHPLFTKFSPQKGTKVFMTYTFRRQEYFITQLVRALTYFRPYLQLFKEPYLVPEMGAGRLHFHLYGTIKDIFKYRIFVHNWGYKYGNVHARAVNNEDNVFSYIKKESFLETLLDNPAWKYINSKMDIDLVLEIIRKKYYIRERPNKNVELWVMKPKYNLHDLLLKPTIREADARTEVSQREIYNKKLGIYVDDLEESPDSDTSVSSD